MMSPSRLTRITAYSETVTLVDRSRIKEWTRPGTTSRDVVTTGLYLALLSAMRFGGLAASSTYT